MQRSHARSRGSAAVVATALLLTAALPASADTPTDGGAFAFLSVVTINDSAGDQYDPHADGDYVSYTSDSTIRYYDFATAEDAAIPVPGDFGDQLSDVSNGTVTFNRFDWLTFESQVRTFDIAGSVLGFAAPNDAEQQADPAIGTNTVAYFDNVNGEMYAARLGDAVTRLTNDDRFDFRPDISPSGNLVVWESCPGYDLSHCDIHQAAWTGSSWQVTALTSTNDSEANAATDGAVVVYDAERAGERDIYWQAAGGGAEHRLELPGNQRDPAVSGGIISFESTTPGDSYPDLYLYEIVSNQLFRLTSTPAYEHLSDIAVLADGRVRVVWSSGIQPERDVYGATIELPSAGPDYQFGGFLAPVEARPTLNSMKAGAAVPVKFSLGGDEGLAIFATGHPRSQSIACDSTADVDPIEETLSAGASSLSFDPLTGLYTYVWKTDRAWAGTCRQLVLGFADGTFGRANFKLK